MPAGSRAGTTSADANPGPDDLATLVTA
jgi:hypothetical protein